MTNPYADLRSLLDTTRALDPEETAQLLLEQGYVERALVIYDRLVREAPHDATYRQRRAWLRRLARRAGARASPARARPVRRVGRPAPAPPPAAADRTLRGVAPAEIARLATAAPTRAAPRNPAPRAPAPPPPGTCARRIVSVE